LARYPIQWHLIGDAKGNTSGTPAIHDTYNRFVTVHGTNFLRVENNVTYNTVGHCFFSKTTRGARQRVCHNLGIQTSVIRQRRASDPPRRSRRERKF